MAGGVLKPGDAVQVLPSGFETTIKSIDTFDGPVDEAFAPMSVVITLTDEIDVSRGDMICRPEQPAPRRPGHRRDALLVERASSLRAGRQVRHQAHHPHGAGMVKEVKYRLDINTLHRDEAASDSA